MSTEVNDINRVAMIGLGYIGLPTAALMASRGLEVIGVDVNQKAVDIINAGNVHIVEPDLDIDVMVVEPNIKILPSSLSSNDAVLVGVDEALERADIVVGLVDHQRFVGLSSDRFMKKVVLDYRGIWL